MKTATSTTAAQPKTYNGWANYETWAVKLWIDNEEGTYNYWRDHAREILDGWRSSDKTHWHDWQQGFTPEERAALQLAENLKGEHQEALPGLQGFAADLLNAAMSEVNWHEIAESLLDDVQNA
jgi:hypothetical protein